MSDHPGLLVLFMGIFVVWFPTVILVQQLTRGTLRRDMWKVALRNAPQVVRRMVYGSFIYCGAVWAFSMIFGLLGKGKPLENEGLYFSAFMLVFYVAAAGISLSVLAMRPEQLDPHCMNGHRVGAEARYCQACGSEVVGVQPNGA